MPAWHACAARVLRRSASAPGREGAEVAAARPPAQLCATDRGAVVALRAGGRFLRHWLRAPASRRLRDPWPPWSNCGASAPGFDVDLADQEVRQRRIGVRPSSRLCLFRRSMSAPAPQVGQSHANKRSRKPPSIKEYFSRRIADCAGTPLS
jgi:hypothetical protein